MKKLIATLVIVALLLALAPAVVYAAPGEVTGQGKGGNTAPTVDNVTLVQAGSDTEVIAMTPLTTYRVKATCGDINTIDDIEEIEFHVYYSSDGSNWDADACGIFKWTKAGDEWTMENGGHDTSWEIIDGSCIAPSVFTATQDDWYLAFKPGKLCEAKAAQEWFASATATDDQNKKGDREWVTGASMDAYAEIGFGSTTTVVFGDAVLGIEPGKTGYITDPVDKLTALVLTNKQYALGVSAEATWDDDGSNQIALSETTVVPPNESGEFTLIIDATTSGGGEPKAMTQAVTISDAEIEGLGNIGRTSTTTNAPEVAGPTDLYMAFAFAESGIQEVVYTGTITFTVTTN